MRDKAVMLFSAGESPELCRETCVHSMGLTSLSTCSPSCSQPVSLSLLPHLSQPPPRPQACTIPIHIVVTGISFSIAICVLLVIVGDIGTVVTGITK